jgi:hypothetical protein
MKILIICSKRFYGRIPPIKSALEQKGHVVELPNCFDDSGAEERMRNQGRKEHAEWKAGMFNRSAGVIAAQDAVLVLNFEKDGQANYIGGATFIEMYDAFRMGKKIFLHNDIPEGMLKDEIIAFSPIVIEGNLSKVVL